MVIDSSALVAIILAEPDASSYASTILADSTRLMSAVSLVESSIILTRSVVVDGVAALDALITRMRILVIPVDYEQALQAREAFRRFGKGRHAAGLNFGDCFSYALAKQTGEALLYKGHDFRQTDIVAA